jgi:hypothetical protein
MSTTIYHLPTAAEPKPAVVVIPHWLPAAWTLHILTSFENPYILGRYKPFFGIKQYCD